ncbi:MAG: PAS domain S-box protein, partial [Anaerolineae bacterium]|nr:PAS domain S-box protein [Anaerolineae bacterium]
MIDNLIPFSMLLMAASALTVAAMLLSRQQRVYRPTARVEALILLTCALLMFANGMEIASTSLAAKIFWTKVQFIGFVFPPMLWVILGAQFAGQTAWLTRRIIMALSLEPILVLLLGFTNEAHGLIASAWQLDTAGSVPILTRTNGVLLWFHGAYAYTQILLSSIWFARLIIRSGRLYRWQGSTFLASATLGALGGLFDLLEIELYAGIKVMPLVLAPSTLLLLISSRYLWRADWVPVTREKIVETMADSVLVLNADDDIIDLNQACQDLIGRPAPEVIGCPIQRIWPSWPMSSLVPDPGASVQHEIELHHNGALCIFDAQTSFITNWQGQFVGKVVVLRDITTRKQAEQHLMQLTLEREKTEMLRTVISNISHDIKTPLSVINTSLYLVEQFTDPAKQTQQLAVIRAQVERLDKLIQNLLTISRLEYVPELELSVVDVNRLLRAIAEEFRPATAEKEIVFTLELEPDLPPVTADLEELGRGLVNLLENAIKYTSDGEAVTVRTSTQGQQVVVVVSDTGIGISEAD